MAQFSPIEPYENGCWMSGTATRSTGNAVAIRQASRRSSFMAVQAQAALLGREDFFDPNVYRAVLFDQRGSGRSLPLASQSSSNLASNTTPHLIADIERLRKMLGIESWIILGLSWGTTLGLAYAHAHPRRVKAMVLGFVTTTSRAEVQWITEDVGRIFPQEWDRFVEAVPTASAVHPARRCLRDNAC